jgi:cytochrome P450
MLTALLGLEEHEIRSVITRFRTMAALLAAVPMDAETLSAATGEFENLTAWIDKLLDAPASGLLMGSVLRPSSPAERRTLVADLLVLLVTGYDTSKAMLGDTAAALASHPDACGRLAADPTVIPRAAEELIRYEPAGQIIFRHALEGMIVGEHRVGQGEMLALLIGSANRDEAVSDQPDRLDFVRAKGRSLSSGAGPHACIGAAMAKIQLTAFLNALVPHLSRIVADTAPPMVHQHGLVRGRDSLVLRLAPASPESECTGGSGTVGPWPPAPKDESNMSKLPSPSDRAWLSEHAKRAERKAFAAIDRFIQTPQQIDVLKTILSSALDRGSIDGGVCRMALRLSRPGPFRHLRHP